MTRTLERVCDICGATGAKRGSARRRTGGWTYQVRCARCRGIHADRALEAGAIVHPTTRYEDDVVCQLIVSAFPEGLTLEDVGEVLGLSRERIRQIEAGALAQVRRALFALPKNAAEASR